MFWSRKYFTISTNSKLWQNSHPKTKSQQSNWPTTHDFSWKHKLFSHKLRPYAVFLCFSLFCWMAPSSTHCQSNELVWPSKPNTILHDEGSWFMYNSVQTRTTKEKTRRRRKGEKKSRNIKARTKRTLVSSTFYTKRSRGFLLSSCSLMMKRLSWTVQRKMYLWYETVLCQIAMRFHIKMTEIQLHTLS